MNVCIYVHVCTMYVLCMYYVCIYVCMYVCYVMLTTVNNNLVFTMIDNINLIREDNLTV